MGTGFKGTAEDAKMAEATRIWTHIKKARLCGTEAMIAMVDVVEALMTMLAVAEAALQIPRKGIHKWNFPCSVWRKL
jgi:hypothetical protein